MKILIFNGGPHKGNTWRLTQIAKKYIQKIESSLIFGVNCLRHNAMRSSLKREREQSQGSAREAGCDLCSRPQGGRNK